MVTMMMVMVMVMKMMAMAMLSINQLSPPSPEQGGGQVLTTPSSNYCTSCTRGQPTLGHDEDYYREDEPGGGDHDEVVVNGNGDGGLVKDCDVDGASA